MIMQLIQKAKTKTFRYICNVYDYFHLFIKKLLARKHRVIFFKAIIMTSSLVLIFRPLNVFACKAKEIEKKKIRSWSDFIKVLLIKDQFSLIPLGVGLALGIALSDYSLGSIENVNIEALRKQALKLAQINPSTKLKI